MVKSLQPMCLINSRIGHGKHDYVQTGDNAIPIQPYTKEGKWEVPATLNDTWGFKKNDENWKDPRDLIGKLADIVSKGGNYLLNVGPTAEGVIPQASQDILRAIGKWMEVNGESIYGTSPSPFYFPDITWRATVKPGKVYLHLLNWPGPKFRFEGLESQVKRAYLLANGAEVAFRREGVVHEFTLPAGPLDPYDTVLVLDIADEQPRVAAGFGADQLPDRLELYSWVARFRGEEVRYDWDSYSASGFTMAEQFPNELWWYPYKSLNGDYTVEITYACDDAAAGSPFRIAAQQRGAPAASLLEGMIEGTRGMFVTKRLEGSLSVRPETEYIGFGLPENDKSAAVRVQKITLIKGGN
jgi:hypothetical protein